MPMKPTARRHPPRTCPLVDSWAVARATTVHTCLPIIGGAEDKVGRGNGAAPRRATRRWARRTHRGQPQRVVLADEACKTYNTAFGRLGAPQVVGANPRSRQGAAREALVSAMDDGTGVLMTAAAS
jgi:hypothetical protein